MSSRSPFSRVAALFGAAVAIAIFAASAPSARADQGPILVFPLASSVDDVTAAQSVTSLVAQRLRFVYGDQVKLVADLGSESLVDGQARLDIPVLAPGSPTAVLRRSGARPPLHLAGALLLRAVVPAPQQ